MSPETKALLWKVAIIAGIGLLCGGAGLCVCQYAVGAEPEPFAEAVESASDLDYTPAPGTYTPIETVRARLTPAPTKTLELPQRRTPTKTVLAIEPYSPTICSGPACQPQAAWTSGYRYPTRPRLFFRRR